MQPYSRVSVDAVDTLVLGKSRGADYPDSLLQARLYCPLSVSEYKCRRILPRLS